MNQLTPKQEQWIAGFIELTGGSVDQIGLESSLSGQITWGEFMEAEIRSWRDWQDDIYKQIQGLWEE